MYLLESLHRAVLLLPIITALCFVFFVWQLFSRYNAKGAASVTASSATSGSPSAPYCPASAASWPELYAEFSNANFFRPQPGRRVITTYRLRF
ncbi:MAG: hypothetical protein IH936_13640 [Acidobacteria bacterium]|nr:hypothetical protein [Acidobacteriota bacterium]